MNFFKHLHLVNRHRWLVFKLCFKAGIPWRGLVHDLSKYSWTELKESVYYYNGKHSPLGDAKKDKGYSTAWLHHKGCNKHHHEYWYDPYAPVKTPIIPYKYMVEMVCDNVAAAIIYNGKNYTQTDAYDYFMARRDKFVLNEKMKDFLESVYLDIAKKGNKALNKCNLKEKYDKIK